MKYLLICLALLLIAGMTVAEEIKFKDCWIMVPGADGRYERQAVSLVLSDSAMTISGRAIRDRNPLSALKSITNLGSITSFKDTLTINYSDMGDLLYERSEHTRGIEKALIAPWTLLWKGKQHWLSFNYSGPDSTKKSVLLQLDKDEQRYIRQALSQKTGKHIETIIE